MRHNGFGFAGPFVTPACHLGNAPHSRSAGTKGHTVDEDVEQAIIIRLDEMTDDIAEMIDLLTESVDQ